MKHTLKLLLRPNVNNTKHIIAIMVAALDLLPAKSWFPYSGATNHMTHD